MMEHILEDMKALFNFLEEHHPTVLEQYCSTINCTIDEMKSDLYPDLNEETTGDLASVTSGPEDPPLILMKKSLYLKPWPRVYQKTLNITNVQFTCLGAYISVRKSIDFARLTAFLHDNHIRYRTKCASLPPDQNTGHQKNAPRKSSEESPPPILIDRAAYFLAWSQLYKERFSIIESIYHEYGVNIKVQSFDDHVQLISFLDRHKIKYDCGHESISDFGESCEDNYDGEEKDTEVKYDVPINTVTIALDTFESTSASLTVVQNLKDELEAVEDEEEEQSELILDEFDVPKLVQTELHSVQESQPEMPESHMEPAIQIESKIKDPQNSNMSELELKYLPQSGSELFTESSSSFIYKMGVVADLLLKINVDEICEFAGQICDARSPIDLLLYTAQHANLIHAIKNYKAPPQESIVKKKDNN